LSGAGVLATTQDDTIKINARTDQERNEIKNEAKTKKLSAQDFADALGFRGGENQPLDAAGVDEDTGKPSRHNDHRKADTHGSLLWIRTLATLAESGGELNLASPPLPTKEISHGG
jgi:hypothetical protein